MWWKQNTGRQSRENKMSRSLGSILYPLWRNWHIMQNRSNSCFGNLRHYVSPLIVYDLKKKSILRSCNITIRYEKAGCLITLVPKVNISSKIEIHSPTPPVPFDVWVSGSYIRHQGQSLKRQVNLQTDIRGRGFSCTGRRKRAGVCSSTASSSVRFEWNRQLG